MTRLLSELESDLLSELRDAAENATTENDFKDQIHEIVEGCVPMMHADLLALLSDDFSLAYPDNTEGESAWDLIANAVRERLEAHAYEHADALWETIETIERLVDDIKDYISDLEETDADQAAGFKYELDAALMLPDLDHRMAALEDLESRVSKVV